MTARTASESSALTMWRMTLEGNDARCLIVATPAGFEAQCRFNGTLLYSHTMPRFDDASAWSQVRRSEMASRGWRLTPDAIGAPTAERGAVAIRAQELAC